MKFLQLLAILGLGIGLLVLTIHALTTNMEVWDVASGEVDVTLRGSEAEDFLGYTVKGADINGDGIDDLLIGTTGLNMGTTDNVGGAYVVLGTSSLTGTQGITETAVVTFHGRLEENGYAGQIIATGHLNEDTYADMLIASRWSDVISGTTVLTDAGRVYLVYGHNNFSGTLNLDTTAATQFLGTGEQDFTGQGLHIADLNDDGHDDLIIGAYRWQNYTGKVYILWGPGPFAPEVNLGTDADITLLAASTDDGLGYAPTTGDVNGDDLPDLILSTRSSKLIYVFYGGLSLSGTHQISETADLILSGGDVIDAAWGNTVSSADLNGDGYDDIVTAAQNSDYAGINTGAVFVIWGSDNLTGTIPVSETAVTIITGEDPYDSLGRFQLVTTDVISDSLPDIVVGASYADFDGTRNDAGKTYVIPGSQSFVTGTVPVTAVADIVIWGAPIEGNLGQSVAGVDINGDTSTDLIVSAHTAQVDSQDYVGEVYIWYNDTKKVYLPVIVK